VSQKSAAKNTQISATNSQQKGKKSKHALLDQEIPGLE